MKIAIAETDEEIARCYPVMIQLRPHIPEQDFVARVRRQMGAGYRLVYAEAAGKIEAVAGFRLSENLHRGKLLYVDDLVTDERSRSGGYGRTLFDWLAAHARAHGCTHLELDSGVQRFRAHRFYLCAGMHIEGHHFSIEL